MHSGFVALIAASLRLSFYLYWIPAVNRTMALLIELSGRKESLPRVRRSGDRVTVARYLGSGIGCSIPLELLRSVIHLILEGVDDAAAIWHSLGRIKRATSEAIAGTDSIDRGCHSIAFLAANFARF